MPEYQEEWMSHEAIGRNKTLTTNKTTTENFTATKQMKRKRARGKRKERNTASKQSKPTYSRHTILPFSHNRLLFLDTTFIHKNTHILPSNPIITTIHFCSLLALTLSTGTAVFVLSSHIPWPSLHPPPPCVHSSFVLYFLFNFRFSIFLTQLSLSYLFRVL